MVLFWKQQDKGEKQHKNRSEISERVLKNFLITDLRCTNGVHQYSMSIVYIINSVFAVVKINFFRGVTMKICMADESDAAILLFFVVKIL